MQHLIKGNESVTNDEWQIFDASDNQGLPGHALLPISIWKDTGDELLESSIPFGVCIQENEDITEILPFLEKLDVIAFNFPKFADGRAFTYARQLRDQFKFEGEIRAIGDILPDQVNYLQRCGFDAFAMRTEAEVETALAVKDHFSVQYQSDTQVTEPLYRRR
jgi:uncharacterized protein (DUF934 family)